MPPSAAPSPNLSASTMRAPSSIDVTTAVPTMTPNRFGFSSTNRSIAFFEILCFSSHQSAMSLAAQLMIASRVTEPGHSREISAAGQLGRISGYQAFGDSSQWINSPEARQVESVFAGAVDGDVVAGVGMAHHARGGIVPQHALDASGGVGRAVADDHHAGVLGEADADAAAVVQRHPGGPGGTVQQRVQHRPVGDGVGAVLHGLGLAVGRGDRAGIEVVATNDDRR